MYSTLNSYGIKEYSYFVHLTWDGKFKNSCGILQCSICFECEIWYFPRRPISHLSRKRNNTGQSPKTGV